MGSDNGNPLPTPPDGGWGWVITLGAFVIFFIADGCTFSFGNFYDVLLLHFKETRGTTSLIPAFMYGFPLLISPMICALVNVLGSRPVGMTGGLLIGLGFFSSVFATSVGFLCISLGIFESIGLAMAYVSAIVTVSNYFDKRLGLATGMAVSGSGIGTFVFSYALRGLLDHYGWRSTMLIVSGIGFQIIIASALFRPIPINKSDKNEKRESEHEIVDFSNLNMIPASVASSRIISVPRLHSSTLQYRSQVQLDAPVTFIDDGAADDSGESSTHIRSASKPLMTTTSCPDVFIIPEDESNDVTKSENLSLSLRILGEVKQLIAALLDSSIFKSKVYLTFCVSNMLLCMWYGVPFVYVMDYAKTIRGIDSGVFLQVMGLSTTGGQIVLGFLADKLKDCVLVYALSMLFCGLGIILIPLCSTLETICIASGIFGFFVGANYALTSVIVINEVGLEKLTTAFGWLQLGQGIATLIGIPVTGTVMDLTGSFNTAFFTAGALVIFSGFLMIPFSSRIKSCRATNCSDSPITI